MKRRHWLALAGSCALAWTSVRAAEWSFAPIVGLTVDHASNRTLVEEAIPEESGTVYLDATFRRATPTWDVSLRPSAQLNRYTESGYSDANNRFLQLASTWRSERSSLFAAVSGADDDTLSTEQAESGIVGRDTRRRAMAGSAIWSLQQTERLSLEAQIVQTDVEYRGADAELLPGYEYPNLMLTERFAVLPRTTLAFSAFASELRSTTSFGDSRSAGVRVGVDHRLSELTSVNLVVGVSNQQLQQGDERGYIGRFEFTRQGDLAQWRLHAERSIAPSGRGVLVERNEAGLLFTRRFSSRLSGVLSARAVRNEDLRSLLSGERRRYHTAEAGLDWRVTQTAVASFRAGGSRAQQFEWNDFVSGWRTALGLTWTPQPLSISR